MSGFSMFDVNLSGWTFKHLFQLPLFCNVGRSITSGVLQLDIPGVLAVFINYVITNFLGDPVTVDINPNLGALARYLQTT